MTPIVSVKPRVAAVFVPTRDRRCSPTIVPSRRSLAIDARNSCGRTIWRKRNSPTTASPLTPCTVFCWQDSTLNRTAGTIRCGHHVAAEANATKARVLATTQPGRQEATAAATTQL